MTQGNETWTKRSRSMVRQKLQYNKKFQITSIPILNISTYDPNNFQFYDDDVSETSDTLFNISDSMNTLLKTRLAISQRGEFFKIQRRNMTTLISLFHE